MGGGKTQLPQQIRPKTIAKVRRINKGDRYDGPCQTHRGLTTRTLAVIDGGLNVKARVHPLPSTGKPKLLEQVKPSYSNYVTIATEPKKRMFIGLSDTYSFITKDIRRKWPRPRLLSSFQA